jgi:hypothetical protein
MSQHEQVICKFLLDHSSWDRHQLRKKINKIFEQEETDGVPLLGFVPDAFKIDANKRTVQLLEVDGHSYSKPNKVTLICNFWYEMDVRNWFVEFQTIHLFTGSKSYLKDDDLASKWHSRWVKK